MTRGSVIYLEQYFASLPAQFMLLKHFLLRLYAEGDTWTAGVTLLWDDQVALPSITKNSRITKWKVALKQPSKWSLP